MNALGGVFYVIEIMLGEFIFIFSLPKRRNFLVRLILSLSIIVLISYFMPIPEELKYDQVFAFFRHLFLGTVVYLGTYFSFDLRWDVTLAIASAASALQHIGYRMTNIIDGVFFSELFLDNVMLWSVIELSCCLVANSLAYFAFARGAARKEYYKNHDKRLNVIAILIVFICNIMTRFTRSEGLNEYFAVNLYAILCSVLALVIQFSLYKLINQSVEKNIVEKLWEEDRKQYEITKQTIETINIKCHDLKHQLYNKNIDEKETRELLDIYDNTLKSGNKILDIILMDYGLRHKKDNISFSFIGDASQLSFIDETDLYSLLGNCISNAVEAVLKINDREKRIISLSVEQKGNLIILNEKNYYDGSIVLDKNKSITTSKSDSMNHGYGIKSMNRIAKKYNGELKHSTKDNIFYLSIYFIK